LAEIVAFLVLGLTVSLHTLPDAGGLWMGLALPVLLSLVVRPLLVGLLLVPVRLARGERLFVLWAGLDSFLLTAGVPDASRLYAIVVVVVAFSVIVHGSLVPTVAARLGCRCVPSNLSHGALGCASARNPAGSAGRSLRRIPSRQSQDRQPANRGNGLDQPRDPRRPTHPGARLHHPAGR
jgi:cell volume regulation protein A